MTLGGQEVFSTRMTASMEITAFAAAGPPVLAGTDLTAAVFDPAHTVGAIDAAPLLKQALASLAPVEPAPAVLAARFHLDVAISARLFSLGDPQLPVTVRPQLADTPEFAPDAVMYGPSAAIAPLGDTTTVGLDLLFVPVVSGAPTADPDKLFVVRAEVAVGPQGRLAHATSLSVRPPIERSAAATFECFASRLHLANAFITTATPRLPGLDAVFSSCRDLVTNGFSALIDDPASRQLIARATFTGPTTRTTAYLGWDTAFLSVVDRLQSTGTDLATLDPDHSNAALDAALARATTLLRAVPSGAPAELRATVVPTSLRWALDGVSNLNELDRLIPATLANVGAVYPASVLRMLDDVTAGAPAGLAAARCGELLVGDRAVRVAATLARSAAIPEAANFTTALRNQMLQTCPDDATLARIDAAVDAARTFVAEDRARSTTATFDGSVKLFVNHTLRETWTTASYTALGDLLALAVLRRQGCASAPSYSEQVILCLNNHLERISTALGALLDPARVQRHVEFARALLPIRAGWLSDAAFVTVRSAFDAAFFDRALWFSCSDDGFKAAQTLLIETLDRLSTAAPTDQPDIEDEILAQLTATRCPASQVAAAQVR
jgi:hypothetical protein